MLIDSKPSVESFLKERPDVKTLALAPKEMWETIETFLCPGFSVPSVSAEELESTNEGAMKEVLRAISNFRRSIDYISCLEEGNDALESFDKDTVFVFRGNDLVPKINIELGHSDRCSVDFSRSIIAEWVIDENDKWCSNGRISMTQGCSKVLFTGLVYSKPGKMDQEYWPVQNPISVTAIKMFEASSLLKPLFSVSFKDLFRITHDETFDLMVVDRKDKELLGFIENKLYN